MTTLLEKHLPALDKPQSPQQAAFATTEGICCFPQAARQPLQQLTQLFVQKLGHNLSGLYLHGSLAFGCWNPLRSDMDLLAVIHEALTVDQKKSILDSVEALWHTLPGAGVEFSIILADDAAAPFWPLPYQLHYSKGWRSIYQKDPFQLCNYNFKTDRDLSAHLTVVRQHGVTLAGMAPQQVIGQVPVPHLLQSLWWEIGTAQADILLAPTTVILNLCRGVAFAKDGLLLSKEQGAHWGVLQYPAWKWLICRALEDYKGRYRYQLEAPQAKAFAHQLLTDYIALSQELGTPHFGFPMGDKSSIV
ncbi:MAG: DUF4111 domain-containing protein [Angelakisella sp.]|nr:DUF4111 domain-containing protein [Angelakisella sp.]